MHKLRLFQKKIYIAFFNALHRFIKIKNTKFAKNWVFVDNPATNTNQRKNKQERTRQLT